MPARGAADFAHCEALLREADPDAWLAALFAPAARRPLLHAIGAVALEVGQVRERVRQPVAGEIRLQWWQDVVDGARDGEAAAHPVAAALRAALTEAHLPAGPLTALLDARRAELYDDAPPDTPAAERDLVAIHGGPIALAVAALGGDPEALGPAIGDAAVALGVAAWLDALPRADGRRRVLLPPDLLARHGASQGGIDAGRDTPGVRAALAELRARARARLAALGRARRALGDAGPAFLTAALVEPRLAEGERAGPFSASRRLPQWRRQWRLWRAARAGGAL